MSLEATCSCQRCNAHLCAVRVGRRVVHVDVEAHASGEILLFAGSYLELVPEHAPHTRFTIKASQIGTAQRFRDHDLHCPMRKRPDPDLVKTRDARPTRIRRM